ncbi:MAG: putative rane protein [Frankiales bacterium]|nr:putative rane protein [Frankiales bacterium]
MRADASREDGGYATVLVLSLVAVLLAVAGVLVSLGLVVTTRHRAGAAADLAALAAAERALEGAGAACAAADRVVLAAGGRLVTCRLDGSDASVGVELLPPGRLAVLGPARATARAGSGNAPGLSRVGPPGLRAPP